MADCGIDGSGTLRTHRHLVQHSRHTFSQLLTEQPGAGLNKGPPQDSPDPAQYPPREEVPRECSRDGPDPNMPAASQQSQQKKDRHAARQPNDDLRVAEDNHLGLQDQVASLALRDSGLTCPELVETLVYGR